MLEKFRQEYKNCIMGKPYNTKTLDNTVGLTNCELSDYLRAVIFPIEQINFQPSSSLSHEGLDVSLQYFKSLKSKFPLHHTEIDEFAFSIVFHKIPNMVSFANSPIHNYFEENLFYTFDKMSELNPTPEAGLYINIQLTQYINRVYPQSLSCDPESTEYYAQKILHKFMQSVIEPKDIEFFRQRIEYMQSIVDIYQQKTLLKDHITTIKTAKTHKI